MSFNTIRAVIKHNRFTQPKNKKITFYRKLFIFMFVVFFFDSDRGRPSSYLWKFTVYINIRYVITFVLKEARVSIKTFM